MLAVFRRKTEPSAAKLLPEKLKRLSKSLATTTRLRRSEGGKLHGEEGAGETVRTEEHEIRCMEIPLKTPFRLLF